MLIIIGVFCAIVAVLNFVLFAVSMIKFSVDDGLKEFVIFTIIAAICIGTAFFAEKLIYEETVVNEYEVVSFHGGSFLYKTEDNGTAEKIIGFSNKTIYESESDRYYALETVTTVKSRMKKWVYLIINFGSVVGDEEITYKIYMPKEKYQEYISR